MKIVLKQRKSTVNNIVNLNRKLTQLCLDRFGASYDPSLSEKISGLKFSDKGSTSKRDVGVFDHVIDHPLLVDVMVHLVDELNELGWVAQFEMKRSEKRLLDVVGLALVKRLETITHRGQKSGVKKKEIATIK